MRNLLIISLGVWMCSLVVVAQDESRTASGLKEALRIGIENAVTQVGAEDGYYGDELIRIIMPEKLKKVTSFLDKIGAESLTETLVKRMNRAAEQAAPQALDIFKDSLKDMKITDALSILNGENKQAATAYLKTSTTEPLTEKFKPVIQAEMEKLQVVKLYNEMLDKYDTNPFAKKISFDLDGYVTQAALEGLFTVVGQQEEKIRKDPQAQVTQLLRSVFGKQ